MHFLNWWKEKNLIFRRKLRIELFFPFNIKLFNLKKKPCPELTYKITALLAQNMNILFSTVVLMFSGSKYYWTGAEEQGSPTTNPQPACWPTLPGNNYKHEKVRYNSFPQLWIRKSYCIGKLKFLKRQLKQLCNTMKVICPNRRRRNKYLSSVFLWNDLSFRSQLWDEKMFYGA
jgi:hypothetical protein